MNKAINKALQVVVWVSASSLAVQHALAAPLLKRQSEVHTTQDVRVQKDYEVYQRLEVIQEEMQQLRGLVEEQAHIIEVMKRGERERYLDLDTRITELNSNPTLVPPVLAIPLVGEQVLPDAVPDLEASTVLPVADTSEDNFEQEAYDSAKTLVDNKEYNSAIAEFDFYLETYPKGRFVAQAHYWLGELFLALPEPEYDTAQLHLKLILELYPKHAKVPASLFKLGKLNDAQGKTDVAQGYFAKVIQEYPESVSANLAKQYLK